MKNDNKVHIYNFLAVGKPIAILGMLIFCMQRMNASHQEKIQKAKIQIDAPARHTNGKATAYEFHMPRDTSKTR